jgi:hypothetical protein
MLVIAYNQALIDRNKNRIDNPISNHKKSWWKFWEMYQDEEPKLVENNERMDIIGQNGNDGLHYDDVEPREENDPRPPMKTGVRIQ